MKKIDKICFECKNNIGKLTTIFNIYLCSNCKLNNKYILISKINTKKIFSFNDNDFEKLNPILKKNSNYLSIYYTKENIINYYCEKHCIEHNCADKHVENMYFGKCLKKKSGTKIKKSDRKNIIIKALSEYKLELRNDSVLCKQYIEGSNEYSVDDIVKKMCQMKYLYDYCHMKECLDEAYEEHVEELNEGYFPDMRVSERAEMIALNKYSNDSYPDVFPWI